ncbi:IS3 family transposase [Flavobacterium sp. KJJ]|uniref:IS3 family transposase n=1 Tax=Flavobacterium sp. KJJ TaxID=1270193 RepID=UPI0009E8BFFD
MTSIFFATEQRYGKPRIKIELENSGYQISISTVGRHMKELGLYSKIKKNKVPLL